tara:strand:+ start:2486 stop:2662 length:177 start_codon:yes stop_codon:yes gene_type:complete
MNLEQLENEYVNQLTATEKKALQIARDLGTSFSLKKSIGFLEWIQDRQPRSQEEKEKK